MDKNVNFIFIILKFNIKKNIIFFFNFYFHILSFQIKKKWNINLEEFFLIDIILFRNIRRIDHIKLNSFASKITLWIFTKTLAYALTTKINMNMMEKYVKFAIK